MRKVDLVTREVTHTEYVPAWKYARLLNVLYIDRAQSWKPFHRKGIMMVNSSVIYDSRVSDTPFIEQVMPLQSYTSDSELNIKSSANFGVDVREINLSDNTALVVAGYGQGYMCTLDVSLQCMPIYLSVWYACYKWSLPHISSTT